MYFVSFLFSYPVIVLYVANMYSVIHVWILIHKLGMCILCPLFCNFTSVPG